MTEKLNTKKILLIGLGFFTVSLAWALYNAFVPIFLDRLISSSTLIGFIMTIDNIFGVAFQPMFGMLSDKTNTRIGRRIPFLVVGIPLAALFFILIPMHRSIVMLMLTVIGMNFAMSIYRAPVVAMMPDSTPPVHRSKANGLINFMGGLGTVLAFSIGGSLFKQNTMSPFLFGAGAMLLAMVLLLLFFKEPKEPYSSDEAPQEDAAKGRLFFKHGDQRAVVRQNPSLLFILLAIFFWFCGYNGIETFFTLYCVDSLGLEPGSAAQLLTFMAGAFLVFAIPAGFIGTRFGRKHTILIGIALLGVVFITLLFVKELSVIKPMMIAGGIGWALININSYPTVVEMAPKGQTGRYTGYYYTFSFAASILSPILFGGISDVIGSYGFLFLYGLVFFILAFICTLLVKTGEAHAADQV